MRVVQLLAGVLAVLVLTSCGAKTFRSTWANPEAQPVAFDGQTVVAMVMEGREVARRASEAAIVRELNALGVRGIPAHTLIAADERKDRERVRAAFSEAGAHGAVVVQVVGREGRLTSGPRTGVSMGFSRSFWGWGWSTDTTSFRQETVVSMEILVYDLSRDLLMWAAESETTNFGSSDEFIGGMADDVVHEMTRAGLITRNRGR